MKERIREFLHASPFQPFVIRVADGREYRIDHPDFVFASPDERTEVVVEDRGHMHYLSAFQITSVERLGSVGSAA